jgi:exosortase
MTEASGTKPPSSLEVAEPTAEAGKPGFRARCSLWFAGLSPGDRFWLTFWLGGLLAFVPLVLAYLAIVWQLEHYQYVPLAFIAVAALAWSRADGRVHPPHDWLAGTLILFAFAALLAAMYLYSPWLATVGLVAYAAAWLWVSREPDGRSLIGLVLPLAMTIRVPLGLDGDLIINLQRWTTRLSSSLLDLAWIPHFVTGNVIGLSKRELFVAEACSGIQSVFTLLFLSTLLIAYKRYPMWYAPLYWLAAVLAAVLGNGLRVTLVAMADVLLELDLASGWSHELVGYLTLLLAFLLVLSFDQFVLTWFHPIQTQIMDFGIRENRLIRFWDGWVVGLVLPPLDDEDGEGEQLPAGVSLAALGVREPEHSGLLAGGRTGGVEPGDAWEPPFTWLRLPLVAGGLLALISLGLVVSTALATWRRDARESSGLVAFVPPDAMFPETLGKLPVLDHEIARDSGQQRLGKAADIWRIGDERLRGQLVLSQPYFGWHELCSCYESLAWRLVDRAVLVDKDSFSLDLPEASSREYAMARFKGDEDRYGYLWFSAITYEGLALRPPVGLGSITKLARRFHDEGGQAPTDLMMLQLWVESPQRLEPEDVQMLTRSFEEARARLVRAVGVQSRAEGRDGLVPPALGSSAALWGGGFARGLMGGGFARGLMGGGRLADE